MNATSPSPRNRICRYCSKTYVKTEHLVRHERSHTGVKPYSCPVCQKAFARQDTLNRHKKLHTSDGASVQDPESPSPVPNTSEECQTTKDVSQTPINSTPLQHDFSFGNGDMTSNNQMQDIMNQTLETEPIYESPDLLQFLFGDNLGWPLPDASIAFPDGYPSMDNGLLALTAPNSPPPLEEGPSAVKYMTNLVAHIPLNVTREVEARGITSSFLTVCQYMYFTRFNVIFPIVHEPTFVAKECDRFLLLNIFAIGSLFIGTPDAIEQGELLWRVAQTASVTSWQQLLDKKVGNKHPAGVQIVTAALLGQAYAMLSKSKTLQTTSQAIHGLGFYWARKCGMFQRSTWPRDEIPTLNDPPEQKSEAWMRWVSHEMQLRTLLGLYIIDGQLSQAAGNAPSIKHVANPLQLPCPEATFEAQDADAWIIEMERSTSLTSSFREVYPQLFTPADQLITFPTSNFAMAVILEGLQSLISEFREAGGPAFSVPDQKDITLALLKVHSSRLQYTISSNDSFQSLLRWHALCLDLAANTGRLCKALCRHSGYEQKLYPFPESTDPTSSEFDLKSWARSGDGRRSLLHAIAIQEIGERLSVGHAYPTHIPASTFAAAIVYCAMTLAELQEVKVPKVVVWDDVWDSAGSVQEGLIVNGAGVGASDASASRIFVQRGESLPGSNMQSKNLSFSLHTLQAILRAVSSQWGVCHEMLGMIDSWLSASRQMKG